MSVPDQQPIVQFAQLLWYDSLRQVKFLICFGEVEIVHIYSESTGWKYEKMDFLESESLS